MHLFTWKRTSLVFSTALALSSVACGDDGGSTDADGTESSTDADGTAEDADAGTEVGSTDNGTDAGTTDTTDTTTDPDTTDTAPDTGTDTSDTGDTTDTTDTADTTDTTTGNLACLDYETQDECDADPDCQSVTGQKLKTNGADSPCLQESDFLGCIPQQGCGDALTYFCQGNNVFLVPDTCGPDGFEMCEGPADAVDCP